MVARDKPIETEPRMSTNDSDTLIDTRGWEQLGYVPLESGQILLADPLYIDEHWRKVPFEDVRKYRHKETGDILEFRVDFVSYAERIPKHEKSMNDLMSTREWESVPYEIACELSCNTIAHTTCKLEGGGEVAKMAVAAATGFDGLAPVFVRRGSDGKILQMVINFA